MFFGLLLWVSLGVLVGWCASLLSSQGGQQNVLEGALVGGGTALSGYFYNLGLDPDLLNLGSAAAALAGALLLLGAYQLAQRAFLR